ncbi:MAG TPA: 4Fe-4S dicluster domain-containing protein [Sedimentisphaerales bacterium]|nr:4Fe-4S dicluster domain-containing protein [Sedimentisphaerales bacterium]
MRLPKLRELKEAVTAVFSPRFTTRFPAEPCVVPEKYRGKPEFDLDNCIGCGACVNVCPTEALTQSDDLEAHPPVRRIKLRYDTCIFCGNCADNCTTKKGIKLSNKWDLAGLDRESMAETHDFELQMCEKCGALIGAKKHLIWLYEKLGPLAYTNPSLLLAKSGELLKEPSDIQQKPAGKEAQTSDFMRVLCPKCKCELNIRP